MLIKATQKYTRQTPRKVRLVANSVKSLSIVDAIQQLAVIERRAALVILKTLRQALANAINNHHLAVEDLEIDNILVTEGPRYKRFQAVSRGRAHSIIKRTSHVTVILKTVENKVKTADKSAQKKAQPHKEEKSPAVAKKALRSAKKATRSKKTSAVSKKKTDKKRAVSPKVTNKV